MSATLSPADLHDELVNTFRNTAFDSSRESRKDAIEHFESLGFPGNKSEEYRFTPITRNLEKHFSASCFEKITPASIESIDAFKIHGYDAHWIVFVNGQFSEQFSTTDTREQFSIQSLKGAVLEGSELVFDHFSKLAESRSDAFAALNTAFWQDGIFIRINDNTRVEKPIVILHVHDARQQPVVGQTRLLMIVGANSEATLIEKFDSIGAHPVFCSWVEEIAVKEKGKLTYYKIQNDPGQLYQVANTTIHQKDSSKVNTFTLSMSGQLIRNNFEIVIDGERCESHFYGLYLLDKNTIADNHTVVDHRKPNSFSNELYKGIMEGTSKGVFNGKIYVRPQAQKTNAFQSNRNILLSDSATINTKPQLEIWADDVKCSHGCTTGQLDEEALFYLQSRGIAKPSAQAMLMVAFAGEIVDPIRDNQLKAYLDDLISARLHKHIQS